MYVRSRSTGGPLAAEDIPARNTRQSHEMKKRQTLKTSKGFNLYRETQIQIMVEGELRCCKTALTVPRSGIRLWFNDVLPRPI